MYLHLYAICFAEITEMFSSILPLHFNIQWNYFYMFKMVIYYIFISFLFCWVYVFNEYFVAYDVSYYSINEISKYFNITHIYVYVERFFCNKYSNTFMNHWK